MLTTGSMRSSGITAGCCIPPENSHHRPSARLPPADINNKQQAPIGESKTTNPAATATAKQHSRFIDIEQTNQDRLVPCNYVIRTSENIKPHTQAHIDRTPRKDAHACVCACVCSFVCLCVCVRVRVCVCVCYRRVNELSRANQHRKLPAPYWS